jgi:hypothetical protein
MVEDCQSRLRVKELSSRDVDVPEAKLAHTGDRQMPFSIAEGIRRLQKKTYASQILASRTGSSSRSKSFSDSR